MTTPSVETDLPPLLSVTVTVIAFDCAFAGTVMAPWNSPVEPMGNGPNSALSGSVMTTFTSEVTSPWVLTPQPAPKTSTVEPGFAELGLNVTVRFWMVNPDEVAARPPLPSEAIQFFGPAALVTASSNGTVPV